MPSDPELSLGHIPKKYLQKFTSSQSQGFLAGVFVKPKAAINQRAHNWEPV